VLDTHREEHPRRRVAPHKAKDRLTHLTMTRMRNHLQPTINFVAIIFLANAVALAADAPPARVDFNRDIRPLLSKNCFACHGSDEQHREAGLRLDQFAGATTPAESAKRPIVPGKPDESEVVRRISSKDDAERMPPPDGGNHLNDEQIALIRLAAVCVPASASRRRGVAKDRHRFLRSIAA
jgi:mono/diheme cytochrome c family protein